MLGAMSEKAPIAIVVPMDDEFAPYRALFPAVRRVKATGPWEVYEAGTGPHPLLLIISDVGPVNAAAATERVIGQFAPRAVLHGGSAGSHNPELLPGDVVVGERYVIHTSRALRAARAARGLPLSLLRFRQDGKRVTLPHVATEPHLLQLAMAVAERELRAFGPWDAPGWPAALPPRTGRAISGIIASADAWTIEPADLAALREDFGAECEDMESAYVAQVCALHRVPFLAIRAISDNEAACALTPADVRPCIAAAGLRAARILGALALEL
jgi:adenosylhomocysteine nucleosidase